MVVLFFADEGHPPALRPRGRASSSAEADDDASLPSRVHAIVLVSKVHKPTLRALAYAQASRPDTLEAVTVDVDRRRPRGCMQEWDARGIPVPLKVLDSPYREITRPVLDYVAAICAATARATWSRSTSPSTSSGTGGSSCCTTRARCGSRAGCCSRPA